MNTYETTATVEGQGEVHVAGLPFAPGTEVEISISLKLSTNNSLTDVNGQTLATARARMQELFATIKGFRMAPKFRREELYDRRCVH